MLLEGGGDDDDVEMHILVSCEHIWEVLGVRPSDISVKQTPYIGVQVRVLFWYSSKLCDLTPACHQIGAYLRLAL